MIWYGNGIFSMSLWVCERELYISICLSFQLHNLACIQAKRERTKTQLLESEGNIILKVRGLLFFFFLLPKGAS